MVRLSNGKTVVIAHVVGWDPVSTKEGGYAMKVMTLAGTIDLFSKSEETLKADIFSLELALGES